MSRIIALCGAKQCGKSTLSKHLQTEHGYEVISFADPLYAMVSALAGCDARTLPKEEPLGRFGGKTLRTVLQTLGTEWGRDIISESIWLDTLVRRILEAPDDALFVVDDARFCNEFAALTDLGAMVVTIVRDNGNDIDTHSSEKGWQEVTPDLTLHNVFPSAEAFCDYAERMIFP